MSKEFIELSPFYTFNIRIKTHNSLSQWIQTGGIDLQNNELQFLDAIVNDKVVKVESRAKSYYLEVEVAKGIKTLATEVNKTESQFVNDLMKAVVNRYLKEIK